MGTNGTPPVAVDIALMEQQEVALKAQAYDCIANVEAWQGRLRETNAQIVQVQRILATARAVPPAEPAQPAANGTEPVVDPVVA